MFRWYKGSKMCYVFLSDVTARSPLAQSAWFTRGWTLQELLAPRNLTFFDHRWHQIGKISKGALPLDPFFEEIAAITGIPTKCQNTESGWYQYASIAAKKSWASRRKTTRSEDMAYCLLGIFDVNMPLLYGEGDKAFRRLQLEIMKESADKSIFAWIGEEPCVPKNADPWEHAHFESLRYLNEVGVGVLAKHPRYFAQAGDILTYRTRDKFGPISFKRQPYTMTNLGLDFHALLVPYKNRRPVRMPNRSTDSPQREKADDEKNIHYLALNCHRVGKKSSLAIILTKKGHTYGRRESYSLVDCKKIVVDCEELDDFKDERERIYLYA